MFLPRLVIVYSITISCVKTVIEPHISDFLKTAPVRNQQNAQQEPHSNDSHRFMNYRSMIRRLATESREEQTSWEIELGHTGRKEFIPLMKQRNKHEDRANGALIAGVLLGKEKPLLGQPLKKYAKEQRKKSQEIQRRMNAVKAAGHVDPELERQDTVKLIDANYKFTHKEVAPIERQMVIKQRKSAKRREDIKRPKDAQSPDAQRRFNERRKVMKRTRKG